MDAVRDAISILVSLVIPLMDIQFRVSSLDRSLIVKDRCTPCFEELDNGSMRRKFRREIENLEDRLLYRGCIEIDNLSVQAIESFPVFPSPRNVPRARSKIIDKRNNETRWLKLVATYVTNEWDRNRNCSASIPTLLIHLLIYRLYHCPNGS